MRSSPSRNCQTLPRPTTDPHFMCSLVASPSLALAVISDAERKGLLKPGDTVVEATSGNTGIAVAMVCAQRGYDCVICMAEPFSVERRKIMRMLGAKVIVTPKAGKGTGMVAKAEELCEKHGWFLCSQFENDANPAFHASTTGPEILRDFRRQAAGLLRHRLRHRRNLPGRRPRHQGGAQRHQDCPPRARGCWPHRVRYQD